MMKAGSDLLLGIYNVTFTTQKLQAQNKTLLQFLGMDKMMAPAPPSKRDPFLEAFRPLF